MELRVHLSENQRDRASAHQHKALNIYADLQTLTAPSVTPITSPPCVLYPLLPSSSFPLHTYINSDTSALFSLVDNEDSAGEN